MATKQKFVYDLVAAVRSDPVVGRGTCSNIDECWDDKELKADLEASGITNGVNAILWARKSMKIWLERGLDQREGTDEDPQLISWREFRAACKANPIPSNTDLARMLGWAATKVEEKE